MADSILLFLSVKVPVALAQSFDPRVVSPTPAPPESVPGLIGNAYQAALLISGLLAFGMIVYGGIRHTFAAGNPSGKSEARDIITQALVGLLLLLGAYLILNVINPDLTTLRLPDLTKITPAPLPTPLESPGLTDEQARVRLEDAGILIASGIQLSGVTQATINELMSLKYACNCSVTITSATGGVHEPGACSHTTGNKVDLRSQGTGAALTSFIQNNYAPQSDRSNGDKAYRAPSGALYVHETNPPPNPPASWAPHWDVAVCQ